MEARKKKQRPKGGSQNPYGFTYKKGSWEIIKSPVAVFHKATKKGLTHLLMFLAVQKQVEKCVLMTGRLITENPKTSNAINLPSFFFSLYWESTLWHVSQNEAYTSYLLHCVVSPASYIQYVRSGSQKLQHCH